MGRGKCGNPWSVYAFVIGLAGLSTRCGGHAATSGGTSGQAGVSGAASHAGAGALAGASAAAGNDGLGTAGVDSAGGSAGESPGAGGEGGTSLCEPGFATCPGTAECATDLSVGNPAQETTEDCGACGITCSLHHANSAKCVAGSCSPECAVGFGNCDADPNNGCESSLSSSSDCGSCRHECSRRAASDVRCLQQACVPTCAEKYADCKPDNGTGFDDGCETYLDSNINCATSCTKGVTCLPEHVCNAGVCGLPQGLVALSVPLTVAGQTQRFADTFSTALDLSASNIVLRVYAPHATGGLLTVYAVDTSANFGLQLKIPLDRLSSSWNDVEVPAGAVDPFDSTSTRQIVIEVNSGSDTSWSNPTVVYVDGIRSSNALLNDSFDSDIGALQMSSLVNVVGATCTWTASVP